MEACVMDLRTISQVQHILMYKLIQGEFEQISIHAIVFYDYSHDAGQRQGPTTMISRRPLKNRSVLFDLLINDKIGPI